MSDTFSQPPRPVTGVGRADRSPSVPVVRTIRPVKRRVPISDIWTSWPVARVIAVRDMKIRYKQSVLGAPWLILQPAGILGALGVVFAGVVKVPTGGVPYVWFALVGLSVWTFFQLALTQGTISQVTNSQIVRRIACPRVAFVTGSALSALLPGGVILAIAIAGLLLSGQGIPVQALTVPLWVVWLLVMVFGMILILAAVTTRYRDTYALIPFILQAGLFLTPVGYQASDAPPHVSKILALNPLTGFLEVWRWSLLGGSVQLGAVLIAIVWTVVLVVGGWRIFGRMETRFADFI